MFKNSTYIYVLLCYFFYFCIFVKKFLVHRHGKAVPPRNIGRGAVLFLHFLQGKCPLLLLDTLPFYVQAQHVRLPKISTL